MKYDVKNFTLEEKFRLLEGKAWWCLSDANGKLPEVHLADGPHGLRKETPNGTVPSTAMPTLAALSYTWNPDLAFLDGATMADDCIENDVDVLLTPGVNIKRTPLCGRNFEYFSEDPLLAGIMAKAVIEGCQSKGVGTSLKHFIANNREFERFGQTSEVDERTLREIYLPAFEIALQAKPWTVMCSHNLLNGVWVSENKKVLNGLLREELGFDGVIVSDWGAVHDAPRCVKASMDLGMPNLPQTYDELKSAYESGELTDEEIDACIERILALVEKAKTAERKVTTTKEERHQNAVSIAKEAMVLLKNEDNILPLKEGNILVTGQFDIAPPLGGGGSALAVTDFKQQPLHILIDEKLDGNANVRRHVMRIDPATGYRHHGAAYSKAMDADTVVLCVGNHGKVESENFDRSNIRLTPEQEEIIINLANANENLVVVLYAGSAIDMSAWIDKVKAVVFAGFAGEGVNEALSDILTGKVCPSGKLSETFPLCIEDTPTGLNRGNGFVERYSEGVLVGYRWYDTKKKDVLFPFGYGLSYANFEYFDLKIDKESETDYEVSFTIKNTSNIDAKEVAQVYVRDMVSMVERPFKELKGFTKVDLKAGESKRVSIKLDYRSFAFYNVALDKWHVENGKFEILVGASSRDIRLKQRIDIELPRAEQYTLPEKWFK